MERVLYAIGLIVGRLIMVILELIFLAVTSRRPKATQLLLPLPVRYEHTHIVAGSGHGKTQLLQCLIATHDLDAVSRGERSLIVVDSQGDLIRNILCCAEFSPQRRALAERLIYIDPTDILHPPCLNLFDFGISRLQGYSPLEQETLINGAISLYEYLFGALLGAELTNRQGVIFCYLARLMMVVPGATIYTLMDFMEDPQLVRPYLPQLDPSTARFFQTLFLASGFDNTRQHSIWYTTKSMKVSAQAWGIFSPGTSGEISTGIDTTVS